MVTKSLAKAKVNEAKVQETGAKAKAKGAKVKSKPKMLSGSMEVKIDPARAGALARLYAWLATDLADWQTENGGAGQETAGNCPVIVQIHNQSCRALDDQAINLARATKIATSILETNTQNRTYIDKVTNEPFEFLEAEILALKELMMNETFVALAPYIPLGELEMW